MKSKLLHIVKNRLFIGLAAFLLGALVILGIRLATYKPVKVHYHANFALFVNGKREEFKGDQYYEEIQMCSISTTPEPSERAHMHDNINDVVHVEDNSVTWGQFFTNLGWSLGRTTLEAPDGTVYAENGDSKLHIMLNGEDRTGLGGISNRVIGNKDKLLISFGNEDNGSLQKQYSVVPDTAEKYNNTPDPATCSGSKKADLLERMHHMF